LGNLFGADPYIYVDPPLKKKLRRVQVDHDFKRLQDVILDMYNKCYPEENKNNGS
jgi:hypothetical protein